MEKKKGKERIHIKECWMCSRVLWKFHQKRKYYKQ